MTVKKNKNKKKNTKNARSGVLQVIKKHLYLIAFVDDPISQTDPNYSLLGFRM